MTSRLVSHLQNVVPSHVQRSAKLAIAVVFAGWGDVRAGGVRLRDSQILAIVLQRQKSWAKSGFTRTTALLNQVQGHYNITALLIRDMCSKFRQLKQL